MKFIHLSDCHLSENRPFSVDLSEKIRNNLRLSLKNVLEENKDCDFCLISGDLYEKNFFSYKDYLKLFELFEDFGKDIYYVAGNHDYLDSYTLANLREGPENLQIFLNEDLDYFEREGVRIYGLSYYDRICKKSLPKVKLDSNFYNILNLHAQVGGEDAPYLTLNLNELKSFGFDYVGLGHIHKYQDFGDNIFYVGSLEPMDFSDRGAYGYNLVEDGKVTHIESSLMNFINPDLFSNDFFGGEGQDFLKGFLKEGKENFLRVKILGSNLDLEVKNPGADYFELDDMRAREEGALSQRDRDILDKIGEFIGRNKVSEDIKKKAYEEAMDALLRSKND